ncbi:MAG: hypothetical protein AAB917_02865, partial [Patescibacteria group bacterium]
MENDQKILDQKYDSLPQDLKEAIASVEIGKLIADIGEEQGLMLDQSADLIEEAGLVMLGITPTQFFTKKIQKRLGIDEKKANLISTQINEKVFNKIRASLQKIQAQSYTDNTLDESITSLKQPEVPLPTPPPPQNPNLSPLEKAGGFEIIN